MKRQTGQGFLHSSPEPEHKPNTLSQSLQQCRFAGLLSNTLPALTLTFRISHNTLQKLLEKSDGVKIIWAPKSAKVSAFSGTVNHCRLKLWDLFKPYSVVMCRKCVAFWRFQTSKLPKVHKHHNAGLLNNRLLHALTLWSWKIHYTLQELRDVYPKASSGIYAHLCTEILPLKAYSTYGISF